MLAPVTANDTETQLASRYLKSAEFNTLYHGAMELIEESATYLDRVGRHQVKAMQRRNADHYHAISTKLTTRLMNTATILLTLRSMRSGEMDFTRGMHEIETKGAARVGTPISDALDDMPSELVDLAKRADENHVKVASFFARLRTQGQEVRDNPVHSALAGLQAMLNSGRD
jgi:regulator of CtrA degradation